MPRARRPSPTSTPARRRVIAYVRVSTDRQAETGLGLEAQRAKVAAYCALHDAELVRLCEDAGASASTLDRPALAEALAELAAGGPGVRPGTRADNLHPERMISACGL